MSAPDENGLVMTEIHDMLVAKFGSSTRPLTPDGLQPVRLPGGNWSVVLRASTARTLSVTRLLGHANWKLPGLADFLIRDHATWLFGRFQRSDDVLVIEATVDSRGLNAESLATVVTAVHVVACHAEQSLASLGALTPDGER